jgi:hypothetical protein
MDMFGGARCKKYTARKCIRKGPNGKCEKYSDRYCEDPPSEAYFDSFTDIRPKPRAKAKCKKYTKKKCERFDPNNPAKCLKYSNYYCEDPPSQQYLDSFRDIRPKAKKKAKAKAPPPRYEEFPTILPGPTAEGAEELAIDVIRYMQALLGDVVQTRDDPSIPIDPRFFDLINQLPESILESFVNQVRGIPDAYSSLALVLAS